MVQALSRPLPHGQVLDLASGPSGSALFAAAAGRRVTAVDISDSALGLLAAEAARRGLLAEISLVQADLTAWRPPPDSYAVVLCTGYWDRDLFPAAANAVAEAGLLGWEAGSPVSRHHAAGSRGRARRAPVVNASQPSSPASATAFAAAGKRLRSQ